MKLLTLGHSNHSQERFLQLVEDAGLLALVDVRTAPASRYNPQFNKGTLELVLPSKGIQYVFAGQYLGGRPSDPGCYKKRALPPEGADYLHEVDYPEVMRRDWFVKAVDRLLEIADEQLTAILCSEENPAECHRHHLIAKYLLSEKPEVEVRHLRATGQLVNAASLHDSVEGEDAEQLSLF